MKPYLFPLLLVTMTTLVQAADHQIKPGESPQNAIDCAAPGDKLILLPGLHQHKLGKHRSILYVDKSIDIELQAGATLKLADGETKLEAKPEITTDQDAGKKLDDLFMGGEFDLSKPAIVTIRIDGGSDGLPAHSHESPSGTSPDDTSHPILWAYQIFLATIHPDSERWRPPPRPADSFCVHRPVLRLQN